MNRRAVLALAAGLLTLPVLGAFAAQTGDVGNLSAAASAESTTSLAVDAADGSLLKAAGGLFRSSDPGESWQPMTLPDGIGPDQIRDVATSTKAPDRLYIAGSGPGVLRSDDRGQTWQSISDGLPSQEVAAFAVHSYLPDTLYAWIAGQGVFRTEDGGKTWELMDEGPAADDAPLPVAALAHSTYEGSMNTGWLYAATPDGPYLSMDCF